MARPLLLVPRFQYDCPRCGGEVQQRSLTLVLHGPERLRRKVHVGRCENCQRRYLGSSDLLDILAEAGWAPNAVERVEHKGKRIDIRVPSDAEGHTTDWQDVLGELVGAASPERVPTPTEVAALDQRAVAWEGGMGPSAWFKDDDGTPALGYILLVVDPEGVVRSSCVTGPGAAPGDVVDAVLSATHATLPGNDRYRPTDVVLSDALFDSDIVRQLAELDIDVVAGTTPLADEALAAIQADMMGGIGAPVLTDCDNSEVLRYFEVAHRFYDAEPWDHFSGVDHVAFRIDSEPWHYATVMGQLGEEPGLAVFDDWLHACRFLYNSTSSLALVGDESGPSLLDVLGDMEGVTPDTLTALHPQDGARILDLNVVPIRGAYYPLPSRFSARGTTHPRLSLTAYTVVLHAISEIGPPSSGERFESIDQTLEYEGTTVTLRYPATGDENLGDDVGAARLLIRGGNRLGDAPWPPLQADARVTIDVPSGMSLVELADHVRAATDDDVWITAVGDGEATLWYEDTPSAPAPFVSQLSGLDELWVEVDGVAYALEMVRRLGDPAHVDVSYSAGR